MARFGTGFPIPQTYGPFEAWRLGWMVSEMWMTSTYNAMARSSWLPGAVPGAKPADQAAMREWQRMWGEKVLAGMEVGMQMQRASYDLLLGKFNPWQSATRAPAPAQRRTDSKARRLAKRQAGV